MRIALVFPPFYHPAMYNLPPLGLINLGTGLQLAGHAPRIVDLVLAQLPAEIPRERFEFLVADAQALPFAAGANAGSSLANLEELLTGGLIPPGRVAGAGRIDWTLRNHRNHFELIRNDYLLARR